MSARPRRLLQPDGRTTCCQAFSSIDIDTQVEYCKRCYGSIEGYLGDAVLAMPTAVHLDAICRECGGATAPMAPEDDFIIRKCTQCWSLYDATGAPLTDAQIERALDVHCHEVAPDTCKYCFIRSEHEERDDAGQEVRS